MSLLSKGADWDVSFCLKAAGGGAGVGGVKGKPSGMVRADLHLLDLESLNQFNHTKPPNHVYDSLLSIV